jgi:hypothetical protein
MPSRYIKNHALVVKENREIVEIPRRQPNLLKLARATLNAGAASVIAPRESTGRQETRVDPEIFEVVTHATGRPFDRISGGASVIESPFVVGAAFAAAAWLAVRAASTPKGWSMF